MDEINWLAVLRDNALSFVIGTVILGTVLELARRGIDYLMNRKYRGWTLHVRPPVPEREEYDHALLWEEVKRFEESRFENRKFIQSVCTSEAVRIRGGQIATDDPDSWIYRDRENKIYRVDFTRMPDDVRG